MNLCASSVLLDLKHPATRTVVCTVARLSIQLDLQLCQANP